MVAPPPVDTIFDFRAAYRLENLSLKYEQLVLLPFAQHLRLTAVEQDCADQGLVNFVCREKWLDCKCLHSSKKQLFAVWILRCISRQRDPRYTNSLMTSKCLSPIATLCPTSRIVISFWAAIIYFVFCSFIFNRTLAAYLSNAK
jgi:hypothetical protein